MPAVPARTAEPVRLIRPSKASPSSASACFWELVTACIGSAMARSSGLWW